MKRSLALLILIASASAWSQAPYKPTSKELLEAYDRAEKFAGRATNATFKLTLAPIWVGDTHMTYRNELKDGKWEYWLVDCASGKKSPAFDAKRMAAALSTATKTEMDPEKLNFPSWTFSLDLKSIRVNLPGPDYDVQLS